MNRYHQALDFHLILEKLSEHAVSLQAKQKILALSPITDEALCRRAILDTSGAKRILETCGTPPIAVMGELQECLHTAESGGMLLPEQLYRISRFLVGCNRMAVYLKRGEAYESRISYWGRSFSDTSELQSMLESSVDETRLLDSASPTLRKLRYQMDYLEDKMRSRVQQLAQSKKKWLADAFVSMRGGHYVLPVLRQYQHQFAGTVIEVSRSGGAVFMEPASVASMHQEWCAVTAQEEQETIRILYTMTDLVAQHAEALNTNAKQMVELDFFFAKAAFSQETNSNEVFMNREGRFYLHQARHPLLAAESCVPLDMELNPSFRGMIITGPNTGGKTVALKTAGLLTLMAQSGLHIPCAEDSQLPMRDGVYCDIGDSQSISQNLSTFSGHMTNIIGILNSISADSLVLLDELGIGTDPAEGSAIAIAIMEALRSSGCFFLATSHYDQVKAYVQSREDLMNARMAFDSVSLQPLYRLEIGKDGKSCALDIVRRLGMPEEILKYASAIVQFGEVSSSHQPELRLKKQPSRLTSHSAANDANRNLTWKQGDSVEVLPSHEKGIVYQPADDQGYVLVQVKGLKQRIRHNRIKLLVPAEELYPDNYDFSIIFDTVENRKARHILEKRYDENATVIIRGENK